MSVGLALLAAVISGALTHRFCDAHSRFYILDYPNERSLHRLPTPRSGGIALLVAVIGVGVVVHMLYPLKSEIVWGGIGGALIGLVSFVDDRVSIHPFVRLVVHAVVTGAVVTAGLALPVLEVPGSAYGLSPASAWIVTVAFIVWMLNLYNFMDGIDGFAGGMAVFGFGTFAMLGWMAENHQFLAVNIVIAGAAVGFLLFNLPPARIFMGDSGSSSLGFFAAVSMVWAARDDIFPFWVGVLIFSPFVVDATVTLVRRLMAGDKIWLAHKTHYYQRLVRLGWGHRKTTLAEYGLMSLCSVSAVCVTYFSEMLQWVVIALWIAVYAGLIAYINSVESHARGRN